MSNVTDIREERGDYMIAELLESVADRIRKDEHFDPEAVIVAYMDQSEIGVTGSGSSLAQVGLIEVAKSQILETGFSAE